MSNLILRGGILRLNSMPVNFKPINILLKKSPAWLDARLIIARYPYSQFLHSRQDNRIEIFQTYNRFNLQVNGAIIYDNEYIFDYTVDVKLNNQYKNAPYASFFKYY